MWEICEEEVVLMLTIESLIAVISLCLSAFGLGFAMGQTKAK